MRSLKSGISCILSPPGTESSESSQKSQAIPTSLIKEDWQLILDQDASRDDLNNAIEKCKTLVLSTEECSYERKWIVRHLVELRFRLRELDDILDDPNDSNIGGKVILGHHFIPRQLKDSTSPTKVRILCDHCTGIIWSVVQASFICADCNYCVHYKCVDHVTRVCANVIASERGRPMDEICPEQGMHSQKYRCADCKSHLHLDSDTYYDVSPRLCDYTGNFYCGACHWNNLSIIPARIIRNWDFKLYKVARGSLQEINLFYERPVIRLEEMNPKLFIFVQNLNQVKKLRQNLALMVKYLFQCRLASELRFFDQYLSTKRHLALTPDLYSLADLVSTNTGTLIDVLSKVMQAFEDHIRSCVICRGKGYLCEICGHQDPLFPFEDGGIFCDKCNSMYHRSCWVRKNQKCPKCIRKGLKGLDEGSKSTDIETKKVTE